MQDLSGMTLGSYHIVERIGQGGMATVFRAFHPATERHVALKVLSPALADNPNFQARFNVEAKVIAKLQHVHILPVFDYGHDKGITYLVMPYVTGGTLKALLARVILSLDGANRLFGQLASAVDYAHRQNILHRDLKPANVLLDSSGNVLLSDFGLAKISAMSLGLTGSSILGTPLYMAPEQGAGEPVSAQSDIYSLGVILYEMVTGQVPYNADTPVAIILKHIQQPLPLPRALRPDLPEAVENVIVKALAKNPRDRYETAAEMAEALDKAVRQAPQTRLNAQAPRPSNLPTAKPSQPPSAPPLDDDARTVRPQAAKPSQPPSAPPLDDDDWDISSPSPNTVLKPRSDVAETRHAVNLPSKTQPAVKPKKRERRPFGAVLASVAGFAALLALGLGLIVAGITSEQGSSFMQPGAADTANIASPTPTRRLPPTPTSTNVARNQPVGLSITERSGGNGKERVIRVSNLSPGEKVRLEIAFGDTTRFIRDLTANDQGVAEVILASNPNDPRGVYEVRVKRGSVTVASRQMIVVPSTATPRARPSFTPRPAIRPSATPRPAIRPSATPRPTIRASARATVTPFCNAVVLRIGCQALVFTTEGDSLRLRRLASINARVLERLQSGAVVTVLDGPIHRDGYTWWQARSASGVVGYLVEYADGIRTLLPLGR
ncbi:MAG: protein kinase [Anaerolineae bacterium]|nr:protein kinase [Anaerolineae bacterium]MDW8172286.1 protein kinase [Anaerolineae bacterium]